MIPSRIRVGNQTSKEVPYADTFHFALRHPITMMMVVVALIGGGCLAAYRMRVVLTSAARS